MNKYSAYIIITLTVIVFNLSVSILTFATTEIPDPDGSGDATVQDILSISGGFDSNVLLFKSTFEAGTLNPNDLWFIIGLDTDLDETTGTGSGGGVFFPLGADFALSFSSLTDPVNASVNIEGGGFQGDVPVSFCDNSFSIAIPLPFLGNDDGIANIGLAVGTLNAPNSLITTDLTIPGSVGTPGPLSGPTTSLAGNEIIPSTTPISQNTDIVVDFGAIGLWARMNDASWQKLHNVSPDRVVVGDVDRNNIEDVIADFSSTFNGIFIRRNLGAWTLLHRTQPAFMAVGDLDNNGQDDIIVGFDSLGLWAWMNDTSWLKLHPNSPDQVAIGDMDDNGQDDVIADFNSTFSGIFVKRNLGGWVKLHNSSPEALSVGDLDNNGKQDVVIDFGTIGLWAWMNDISWVRLHSSSPDFIVTGDIDGNGADDVLTVFGNAFPFKGLWQKVNQGGWNRLNVNPPDEVITGDVDGSGQDDIIAKFGSTIGGIFVKRNGSAWTKLHNTSPDSMATGGLDINSLGCVNP